MQARSSHRPPNEAPKVRHASRDERQGADEDACEEAGHLDRPAVCDMEIDSPMGGARRNAGERNMGTVSWMAGAILPGGTRMGIVGTLAGEEPPLGIGAMMARAIQDLPPAGRPWASKKGWREAIQ